MGGKSGKVLVIKETPKESSSAPEEPQKAARTKELPVPLGALLPGEVEPEQPSPQRVNSTTPEMARLIATRMGTKSGPALIADMKKYNKGDHYEVIVLGAGPVGVQAAVEAAELGLRVALIDTKPSISGAPTGLHSKCLREAVLSGARTWESVNAVAMRATKSAVAATSRKLKTFHVEVLCGQGVVASVDSLIFTPTKLVEGLSQKKLCFDTLILATGSRSNRFPPVDFDLPGVFDSDTIASIDRVPTTLVVQGAGIIGLEYALIFKKLGCESVVIVDVLDKVVPMLDVSLQEACKATMVKEGIEFVMSTKIVSVVALEGSTAESPLLSVVLDGGRVLQADCLLSACGRSGATTGLGLEALEPLGLKVGRGRFVEVDPNGWSRVAKIYAVGDVAGANLATIGQAQAVRAISHCYGSGKMKMLCVPCKPSGVWTIPELAWAGDTEEKAKSDNRAYDSVTVEFNRMLRGCLTNEEGFLKLIYLQDSGKIIGVHMFGDNSCDLINFGAEALNNGDTIYDMQQFVFPAVTYHELYHLAAAEAKLRIMYKGPHNLEAANAWKKVVAALKKSAESEGRSVDEILEKAFRYFDLDSSGFITPPQLKEALGTLGMEYSDEAISEMITEASGSEQARYIDYKHFLKLFQVKPEDGS